MHRRIALLASLIAILVATIPAYAQSNNAARSNLKDDETLQFFRTAARLDEANQEWHVPIHGWVYEPEDSVARRTLFETILKSEFGLEVTEDNNANFTRRINLMIADNERGKRVVIELAGRRHILSPSGVNGQFETTLVLSAAEVEEFADDGVLRYKAVTAANDDREFSGEILLVDREGLSIISDIDDTVKISEVTNRKKLLEHAFLLDFEAAPGMADLYNNWSNKSSSVHLVSSSPWQLYAPLDEFLQADDFPLATFSLKQVRFRDQSLFNLFKKGTETKPEAIKRILETYPDRTFVLVGDSGEHDPEVYSSLMREFPKKIRRVFIRNVTDETATNERFESLFEGIDNDRWQLFEDAATLTGEFSSRICR